MDKKYILKYVIIFLCCFIVFLIFCINVYSQVDDTFVVESRRIADKYDLSVTNDTAEKIDMSYDNQEHYILIEAYNEKLKELRGLHFTKIDNSVYDTSLVSKLNNYIRTDKE